MVRTVLPAICLSLSLSVPASSGAETIEPQIDEIFESHKEKSDYAEFKQSLLTKYQSYLDWNPAGRKALALAWDPAGQYVFARAYGSRSVEVGIKFALKLCNKNRAERSVEAKCVLFAKDSKIVLESY